MRQEHGNWACEGWERGDCELQNEMGGSPRIVPRVRVENNVAFLARPDSLLREVCKEREQLTNEESLLAASSVELGQVRNSRG